MIVHKHELEIARFGARAPRAGTVDVKRLLYIINLYPLPKYLYKINRKKNWKRFFVLLVPDHGRRESVKFVRQRI